MRCSWLASSPLYPEIMDLARRLLRVVVSLAALALVCLPALVVFRAGWLALGHGEASSIERWVLFAAFNLVWVLLLAVAWIWCNDRLGVHWRAWDRAPLREDRRRRRRTAGLRLLEGQEAARPKPTRPRAKGRP
jgi:hypothetical protein